MDENEFEVVIDLGALIEMLYLLSVLDRMAMIAEVDALDGEDAEQFLDDMITGLLLAGHGDIDA